MKVKWLGHASFLITSDKGVRLITDPYTTGGPITYGQIKEAADVVTVSHEHGDHNNAGAIAGKPEIIKGPGTHKAKGLEVRGIATFHDTSGGSQRGKNTVFCFTVDGVRVCHLGDLGHQLTEQQFAEVGSVDVLLSPVGGHYTIDAAVATQLSEKVKPRVIIPMHFKTPSCGYPIAGVDDFLQGRANVRRLEASEVEFKAGQLPKVQETIVLKPAL